MAFDVSILGLGDNVVDRYEPEGVMYPGGNAVNCAVFARRAGAARAAYMGIFGNDAASEHVIASLAEEGIECVKCRQVIGECGKTTVRLAGGERVFLESNLGGVRGRTRVPLDRFDLEYIRGVRRRPPGGLRLHGARAACAPSRGVPRELRLL